MKRNKVTEQELLTLTTNVCECVKEQNPEYVWIYMDVNQENTTLSVEINYIDRGEKGRGNYLPLFPIDKKDFSPEKLMQRISDCMEFEYKHFPWSWNGMEEEADKTLSFMVECMDYDDKKFRKL